MKTICLEHKVCSKCKTRKLIKEFYRNVKAKDGRQSWCSDCKSVSMAASYKNNPGKWANWQKRYRENNPNRVRSARLKKRYGISLDQYNKLLSSQDGKCALCNTSFHKSVANVDHNHRTGKVRGLVHPNCNSIIGLARENLQLLLLAVKYLIEQDRRK